MGIPIEIVAALTEGLIGTCLVTLSCSVFALTVGLALALLRRQLSGTVSTSCYDFFIFVLRAVPIPPLLFLIYFGGPRFGVFLNPYAAIVLSLGLTTAAYLSEVFRGALAAVDPSESESALSSGLSRVQVFWFVEWPQAARMSVPGIINELTSVVKYSPFAYTVGIPEVTKFAMNLTAVTLRGLEIYFAMGVLYFALCQLISFAFNWINRRFRVPGIGNYVALENH